MSAKISGGLIVRIAENRRTRAEGKASASLLAAPIAVAPRVTRNIAIRNTSAKIAELERKILEFREKTFRRTTFSRSDKKNENDQQRLKQEMSRRLADLERKYQAFPVVEFIGLAEVAGMQKVMEYEKQRAQNDEQRSHIKDVSDRLTGYDISSFDRFIEAKSFSTTGRVVITSHEWSTATRIGRDYWLYVVEDALGEGRIHSYQNPAETFKDIVTKEAVVDYQYVISDWKK
ncbi:MAG: DUF3883 domain-containing protein [Nitrososphaera sp.]